MGATFAFAGAARKDRWSLSEVSDWSSPEVPPKPQSPTLPPSSISRFSISPSSPPHQNLFPRTKMTLVTRSAIRLSRRGGASLKAARANAAFFNTAASTAQNVLPKSAATASRVNVKATQGELMTAL